MTHGWLRFRQIHILFYPTFETNFHLDFVQGADETRIETEFFVVAKEILE